MSDTNTLWLAVPFCHAVATLTKSPALGEPWEGQKICTLMFVMKRTTHRANPVVTQDTGLLNPHAHVSGSVWLEKQEVVS